MVSGFLPPPLQGPLDFLCEADRHKLPSCHESGRCSLHTQPGRSRLGRCSSSPGLSTPGQSTKESAAGRICPPTASLYGLKLFSLSPLPQQTQFSRSWGVFWGAAYESPAHSPTTQLTRYFPQCSPTLATHEKHIWAFSKYWTLPTRAEFLEVFLKQMYAGKSPWGILRCVTIRNHQCH